MEREYQFIQDLNLQAQAGAPNTADLAKREVTEARLVPRAAARLWTNAEEPLAGNAFDVLAGIEDLAIVPVVEGPLRDDPHTMVLAIQLVTDQELALRKRVLDRLEQWLDDKRVFSEPPRASHYEEKPPLRRVCDEAYLSLRRLVHLGEDEFEQLVDARYFLSLPEPKRDEVIAKARATKTWRRIRNPDADPDDAPPPSSRPNSSRRK